MNKAVIIVMLFCVSSFTGCIGGDESSDLEVLDENEQVEPVGQNDLSNVSKDLETLQTKVDEFLNDFNSLKSSQEVMNSSLSNMIGDLETDLLVLELDLKSFSNDLDHLHDDMDEMGEIKKDQFLLQLEVSNMSNDLAELVNELNQLTLMSLMDENERAVFHKMKLLHELRENDAVNRDLTEADLSGSDLSGINFAGADLSDANLDGSRFVGNNFSEAIMDNSHANGAYFRNAEFEGVSVLGAHWNDVEIIDSNMADAKFTDSEMHNCIIIDSDLSNSNFDMVNANDCYFYQVYGHSSTWKGASLDYSEFELSTFNDADFSRYGESTSSRLIGITYASVSFVGATFAYADMSHSTMEISPLAIASDAPVMQATAVRARMCLETDPNYGWCTEFDDSLDAEFKDESEMSDNDEFYIYHHSRVLNCIDFMNADLNNTKLDNSVICITPIPETPGGSMSSEIPASLQNNPINARFENAQFRRADLTNVHFGGSPEGIFPSEDSTWLNTTSGCAAGVSCMNFKNTAFSLADLSDSYFDYVDLSDSDFAGSSVGRVVWGHALWMDSTWTDSSTISGRGDPNQWESNDD